MKFTMRKRSNKERPLHKGHYKVSWTGQIPISPLPDCSTPPNHFIDKGDILSTILYVTTKRMYSSQDLWLMLNCFILILLQKGLVAHQGFEMKQCEVKHYYQI